MELKFNKTKLVLFLFIVLLEIAGAGFLIFNHVSAQVADEMVIAPTPTPIEQPTAPPPAEEPAPAPPAEEPKEEPEPTYPEISYSGAFQWGVTMRPNALTGFTAASWAEQITKAQELGTGWARLNWDYNDVEPYPRNMAIINQLVDSGMNAVMVVEHNPRLGEGNMYQDGLNDGKSIASALNGKISYFQMGNEGGAQSIKNHTSAGDGKSDFDDAEYNRVKDYLRGLSEGIASVDSGAKRIVNISWTHTGYLDRLVDDNVDFDMIGIDWYGWMGSFSKRKLGSGQLLYDKLKTFGKPLTFMEVNISPTAAVEGSQEKTVVDEQGQADFISALGAWAWNHRDYVRGFYVLELIDNVNNPNANREYFGIIRGEGEVGKGTMGEPRPAFYAYRDLIGG